MGRYTTIQAYADNNPNMRGISYSQATGKTTSSAHPPATANTNNNNNTNNNFEPPNKVITEKVDNPYGSTAGAGSGEFHVYRHARAREMERLQQMDVADKERQEQALHEDKLRGWKVEEENKLNKNRKKRARNKAAKLRKKNLKLSGVRVLLDNENGTNNVDDEFEYTPLYPPKRQKMDGNNNEKSDENNNEKNELNNKEEKNIEKKDIAAATATTTSIRSESSSETVPTNSDLATNSQDGNVDTAASNDSEKKDTK